MNKGKLTTWNDSKGFGFIKSESLERDTFIHISCLKSMSRKPKVGDFIYFDVEKQPNGKNRATNCRIEGVKALYKVDENEYHHKPKLSVPKNNSDVINIASLSNNTTYKPVIPK